jgi:hypothetical protein
MNYMHAFFPGEQVQIQQEPLNSGIGIIVDLNTIDFAERDRNKSMIAIFIPDYPDVHHFWYAVHEIKIIPNEGVLTVGEYHPEERQ